MTSSVLPLLLSAALVLTPPATTETGRTEWPNTQSCPNSLTPPEPSSTSEMPAPGHTAPPPLPVAVAGDCGVSAVAGYAMPPEIMASAFIVADIDSGKIIAQKDPHGRYRPASIIKGLLALVAARDLKLDTVVTAGAESAAQEGSSVGIGAGGRYTVEQLLQGLLMGSGNDVAHALAQELGGDEAALRKVNELAASLGTTDTYVATYSGLDAPGMSSSPFDLGLIYRAVYADPVLARIMDTEFVDFPGYGEVEGYELWNDNGLFMNDPDGIGGKTGYTDDANHTFVGALERDGRRLMAIILDTTIDGGRAWEQAQRLLHAAFERPESASIGELTPVAVETTVTPTPTPTPGPEVQVSETAPAEKTAAIGVGIAITVMVIVGAVFVAVLGTRRRR